MVRRYRGYATRAAARYPATREPSRPVRMRNHHAGACPAGRAMACAFPASAVSALHPECPAGAGAQRGAEREPSHPPCGLQRRHWAPGPLTPRPLPRGEGAIGPARDAQRGALDMRASIGMESFVMRTLAWHLIPGTKPFCVIKHKYLPLFTFVLQSSASDQNLSLLVCGEASNFVTSTCF